MAETNLTDAEELCLTFLVEAWKVFASLPIQNPNDRPEFMQTIHSAQEKVLCRPTLRAMGNSEILQ
jgi:hypothetical protein